MTKTETEEFLLKLEHKLLIESKRHSIELTRDWTKSFPDASAVYLFRENGEVCYIGETGSLKGRMTDILNTKHHTLRRNLGNSLFAKHPSYHKASSFKAFSPEIESLLNEQITKELTMSYILVDLGRKELEERLFEKLQPRYCIKGKRGAKKANFLDEKRIKYPNAYMPWTQELDDKLEVLFCEGKTTKDLVKTFQRNSGAIQSRIKKLELREKYDRN